MRSHRPRFLHVAAVALAGLLANAGCTYYTVYSQPRGVVKSTGVGLSAGIGAAGCCQCTPCGTLSQGLVGYESFQDQRLELVQYVHTTPNAIQSYPIVS